MTYSTFLDLQQIGEHLQSLEDLGVPHSELQALFNLELDRSDVTLDQYQRALYQFDGDF